MQNIEYIPGDLLKDAFQYDAIAHGANCQCVMGGGIANQIRIKFPQMARADNRTNRQRPEEKIGFFTKAQIGHNTFGYNLYTQLNPGANFNRIAFAKAFTGMCIDVIYHEGKTIGIPYIGCGIGGFSKNEFWNMLVGFSKIFPMLTFYLYDYQPEKQTQNESQSTIDQSTSAQEA